MSISFAGVDLLLPDPDHELQRWIDRNLSLEDVRLFGAPIEHTEGRWIPRRSERNKVGLPIPNWSAPPRLVLNSLWWPTGASRWAIGLYFCTEQQLANIIVGGLDSSSRGQLILREDGGQNRTVNIRMTLLPPRKLNDPPDGRAGYLLPLVDDRYYWQFKDIGNFEVTESTSWEDVLEQLKDELDLSSMPYEAVATAYGKPDQVELTRRHENAAVLLDAVAACIGQRVVRSIQTGIVRLVDANKSDLIMQGNASGWPPGVATGLGVGQFTEGGALLLAGGAPPQGAIRPHFPAQVKVVFSRYQGSDPQADGDVYTVTKEAGLYTSQATIEGTTKVFYDAAAADSPPGGGTPLNLADLSTLADKIAEDYYSWLGKLYDVTYHGIRIWEQTGYDDWSWYFFGGQFPEAATNPEIDDAPEARNFHTGGDYTAFTRVASLPYNFGVSELLHQFVLVSSSSSSSSSSSCSSKSSTSTSSTSTSSTSTSSTSSTSSQSSQTTSSDSCSSKTTSSSSKSSQTTSSSSQTTSSSSTSQSSESTGYNCLEVVTAVEFDPDTCELTTCTRILCFPKGLGITIGEEDCG